MKLLEKDVLQIGSGDFVPAGGTNVLRAVHRHVHFLPAPAENKTCKQMNRPLRRLLPRLRNGAENLIALSPHFLGNKRLNRGQNPFRLRFEFPGGVVVRAAAVVRPMHALGGGVLDEAPDGGGAKLGPLPRPVAGAIEMLRDRFLAAMFEEKLVYQFANGRFLRINDQLFVLPLIPVGSRAAERFAELRPNGNGRIHPFGYLLPLPLRHSGDHRIKKPASRRRSVDGFLEGNEIGVAATKDVCKFEEFFRISSETGELRKDERSNPLAPDIGQHSLSLGMLRYEFAADALQMVNILNRPALHFRIIARPAFVMFRAFSAGLVFGRDANPDSNRFRLCIFWWHFHIELLRLL